MKREKRRPKIKSSIELHPNETEKLCKYINTLSVSANIHKNRGFLLSCLHKAQHLYGHIPRGIQILIAEKLRLNLSDVSALVSFYSFFSEKPLGKNAVYVCNDIIDKMFGVEKVDKVFEKELGIKFNEITKDKKFSLHHTPCIGMCDQAPAALINSTVITNLNSEKVRDITNKLKNNEIGEIVYSYGDGNNAHPLIHSMVNNNIRKKSVIIFSDYVSGNALRHALNMLPEEIIASIKESQLRGCGGAGFPAGLKWEITKNAGDPQKEIICDADEGEPGTFKDRVLLTECSDLLFEGMTIAGYAINADTGILYLREEYEYLKKFLEDKLKKRRKNNLLGNNICPEQNINSFKFDIRIQMGAGSYICGEESALINSCEGLRGAPKERPPFPVQKGYFQHPTSVNNIETYCCACKIIENGAAWFFAIGTKHSKGTKLLSISGDCTKPGVYELPYGISVSEILKLAGAKNTLAVQVGGPSGSLINSKEFNRKICFEDLPTGGAVTIFNNTRNILDIVITFLEFFQEESCGKCTSCRVGTTNLLNLLNRIYDGRGTKKDMGKLIEIGTVIKKTTFCGLGHAAANPVFCSIKNFPDEYNKYIK
jgi:[NiFe] hydrogenase diaphorase moiety large subunit